MDAIECIQCGSKDIETRIVDEVEVLGVMNAVGPYSCHTCENCDFEWYTDD